MRKYFLTALVCLTLAFYAGVAYADEPQAKAESAHDANKTENKDMAPQALATDEPESASAEQAVYEGVVNRRIQGGGNGAPSYNLYYPFLNNPAADAVIQAFVDGQALDYEQDVKDAAQPDGEKPASYDMWDMSGFYTLSRPNPDVVSVTFNIYSYSGGAHGNVLIRTLNFDLARGKRLEFDDLFAKPENALKLISDLTAKKLRSDLGEDADEDMILAGTEPSLDNFANVTLLADGALIEFQPYQVGPWSIGPQQVKLTLEELTDGSPNPAVWPTLNTSSPSAQTPPEEPAPDAS